MTALYPENFLEKIEFDKILQDLARRCLGKPAHAHCLRPQLSTDADQIQLQLAQVVQLRDLLSTPKQLPFQDYRELDSAFKYLPLANAQLPVEDFIEIRSQSDQILSWFELFDAESIVEMPALYQVLCQTIPTPEVSGLLHKVFDGDGEIKDSASPELKSIRDQIRGKMREIDQVFNQQVSHFKRLGYLAENNETVRNGRRVLAVQPEAKRKIRGIIHDTSSSGRTFFIEPEDVLMLNNRLFELRNEEQGEINRILRALAVQLASHLPELQTHLQVITDLDIARAKALQAKSLRAQAPGIIDLPGTHIVTGYHPLLLLKNQSNRDAVVPFSLTLHDETKMVIISGPNAGGKTIALKATGLIQLMIQSGMLAPLDKQSQIGIYHTICGDIGDQQSIEEDLSTYSSHLKNMRTFLNHADEKTLILIDEFGSGTDPVIGAALAESILHAFAQKSVKGVITTHYGNLKTVAARLPHMANAAMEFDEEKLKPTFRLTSGRPGSSYAFEMARRSGLDQKIIQGAKAKMGKKGANLETLLVDLQQDKKKLEDKISALEQREKTLDRLVKNYERMRAELEVRRKKIKIKEKSDQISVQAKSNAELQKVIREIRENEKVAEAKKLSARLREKQKDLSGEVKSLQREVSEVSTSQNTKPFEVGDDVRIKLGGMGGKIMQIKKKKVLILAGNVQLQATLADIEHSKELISLNPTRTVQTSVDYSETVHRKLDLRGMRKEDAGPRIEKFVDKALMANLPLLEIIHGKGSGVLRKAVWEKLAEYNQEFETWHPKPEEGGDGVTLVKIVD